jgi:hypothetical protein
MFRCSSDDIEARRENFQLASWRTAAAIQGILLYTAIVRNIMDADVRRIAEGIKRQFLTLL